MAEKGQPLPKFGEWDVNDPASAEGFTVIFNKARNEKKTGGTVESPLKDDSQFKNGAVLAKPQSRVMDVNVLVDVFPVDQGGSHDTTHEIVAEIKSSGCDII